MKRNGSTLRGVRRSAAASCFAIAAAALAGASCSSVIGIEDWKDPLAAGGNASATGGGGASSVTTVGSVGAGGFGGGPASDCSSCLDTKCDVCNGDVQCNGYRQCMPSPEICCQEHPELGLANAVSQHLWDCMVTQCADVCFPNATCRDCFRDGLETDLDCGGDACQPCDEGHACGNDADCVFQPGKFLRCNSGVCR